MHEVVDLVLGIRDRPRVAVDRRSVHPHELVKRALVAGPQLMDQAAVVVPVRRFLHIYTMSRVAAM
ncbi:hypothetical protein [Microbacterium aurum]